MRKNRFLLLVFLIQIVNSNIYAQQISVDSVSLPTIVIKSETLNQQLLEIPSSVAIIDSLELHRGLPVLLTEAFNRNSGVFVQQGALNNSRITLRGIGARAQYSTNRVRAFYGDIPISSADGETLLHDIEPDAVSVVEILKGPAAGHYGSGLGGVIHLIPFSPKHKSAFVKPTFFTGSFGMFKTGVSTGYSNNKNRFFANYTNTQSDGFRENSSYNRKVLTLHGKFHGSTKSDWSILANYIRLKAYIPSSISRTDFENNPEVAASNWKEAKGYESYDRLLMGISHTYSYSPSAKQISTVYTNYRDAYEPRPFDILKQTFSSYGLRSRTVWDTTLLQQPLQTIIGGELMYEYYNGSTFQNLYEAFPGQGSIEGTMLSNISQKRFFWNAFAEISWEPIDNIEIRTGLHHNQTRYQLTDLFLENDPRSTHTFPSIWSPRWSARYTFVKNNAFYTNISKGFSTPTVEESRLPNGDINTALQPENGWNLEFGYKGILWNSLFIEWALYRMLITDLLIAERIAEDQYVGTNAGRTTHDGIEITLRYKASLSNKITLTPYFSGSFHDYRFTDFTDEGVNYNGNRLTGVPSYTANFGIDSSFGENFSFFSNVLFVGDIPLDDANTGATNSYNLINAKMVYDTSLSKNWQLQLQVGVNNIFNTHYAASILPNAIAFGNNEPRYYYPGNPRDFFAGLSISYILGNSI